MKGLSCLADSKVVKFRMTSNSSGNQHKEPHICNDNFYYPGCNENGGDFMDYMGYFNSLTTYISIGNDNGEVCLLTSTR